MKYEKFNASVFTRRALLLGLTKTFLFSVLVARLYYLQIIKGQHYKTLSNKNCIRIEFISPSRGLIFDKSGEVLANNIPNYKLVMVPENSLNFENVLKKIRKFVIVPKKKYESILKNIHSRPKFLPITILDNVQWEDLLIISIHLPELPGVSIELSEKRQYLKGEIFSLLIGYVQAPSIQNIEFDNSLKFVDIKIGKSGFEKYIDKKLRGIAGYRELEVTSTGKSIRILSNNVCKNGDNIYLTTDCNLQSYIYNGLKKHKSGAVSVILINTGELLACVSYPGYNPSEFIDGLSDNHWKNLVKNPYHPLVNKVISGLYPPASTFKIVVAIAALENSIITSSDGFYCHGYVNIGNHKFHCWRKHGHGFVNLMRSISESCDVYYYELGQKLGIDKIVEVAKKFGLGEISSINFPGEQKGVIPTKEWKKKIKGESWYKGETVVTSIGQGYILATPLQLSIMIARLASGYKINPSIIKTNNSESFSNMGFNINNLKLIQEALYRTVNNPVGTAFMPIHSLYNIAGKTGTAQTRKITMIDRQIKLSPFEMEWSKRDHAIFIGYAPFEKPRYGISVIVEHGAVGKIAADIGRDILYKAYDLKL